MQMNPFLAFCLYVAARVLTHAYKKRPDDQGTKNNLEFLLNAMSAHRKRNQLTESFLVQLTVEIEAAGLQIPLAKPPVFKPMVCTAQQTLMREMLIKYSLILEEIHARQSSRDHQRHSQASMNYAVDLRSSEGLPYQVEKKRVIITPCLHSQCHQEPDEAPYKMLLILLRCKVLSWPKLGRHITRMYLKMLR